ncbi:DUF3046 domain-containing protein [Nocardioides bruguierae]|uniref:DUF3046 domain-containing protein n=1 Tax=Nocardioides bruguierae TaxID=2945102 RepID=UPI0020207A8E|nr:DUF3046 domain-containing protein [Nocardioides bruguierae]MCL8027316.1 DUF3046 domain-containing protein [Nocardioides bruguierae]
MRHTDFWTRMEEVLGDRTRSFSRLTVLTQLGGRTPLEALDEGVPPKQVWAAVHAFLELPKHLS